MQNESGAISQRFYRRETHLRRPSCPGATDDEFAKLERHTGKAFVVARCLLYTILVLTVSLTTVLLMIGLIQFGRNWAAAVIALIVLMFLTVLLYDQVVGRIHREILDRARTYNSLLSSLFPPSFRARIFEAAQGNATTFPEGETSSRVRRYLLHRGESDRTVRDSMPIAELFCHATVMFADIVGFTQWSSSRSPNEVFELLESLYRAFDLLAARRHVFKVETIGDTCE